MSPQTPIVFVDLETSGLDPSRHCAWEIALIRREHGHDLEYLWQMRLTQPQLAMADPKALEINRYHERMAVPERARVMAMPTDTSGETWEGTWGDLCMHLRATLADAILIGSNPHFDARFLTRLLGEEPWHYRPVDIATLAAGYLRGAGRGDEVALPYSSRDLSLAVGVTPPGPDAAHTALADCRWAKDVYDAVTGGGR